tara:strand:- start:3275 stop:3463 length:189 start_codon:yes stop_codon:yes gene_type:complete
MWMLLCTPITVPTRIENQSMVSTNKCRIVTVSPTDNRSRYVIDIKEEIPELNINPNMTSKDD